MGVGICFLFLQFWCAQGQGGGGRKPPVDQEKLQQLAAEGGVEAVQEFLAASGQSAQVMTPKQMRGNTCKCKSYYVYSSIFNHILH